MTVLVVRVAVSEILLLSCHIFPHNTKAKYISLGSWHENVAASMTLASSGSLGVGISLSNGPGPRSLVTLSIANTDLWLREKLGFKVKLKKKIRRACYNYLVERTVLGLNVGHVNFTGIDRERQEKPLWTWAKILVDSASLGYKLIITSRVRSLCLYN